MSDLLRERFEAWWYRHSYDETYRSLKDDCWAAWQAASKEPRDIPAACDREWIRGASFGFQCGYDKALGVEGARERYDGAVEGRRKELAARDRARTAIQRND